ncbi:MAG: RNA polymerase sigma factor [Saprospiraceae bacterium]
MGNEKTPQLTRSHEIITDFHDTYYHALLGAALFLNLDETDADELVASTFEKVCKWPLIKLEEIMLWEKPRTLSYLSTTLNNTHIDAFRKNKNRKEREQIYCEIKKTKWENSIEATYLSNENIRIIKKAYFDTLEKEPKIIRVAFYLRTDRGFKNKEIATLLKMPSPTVATNFHRVRLKIKKKIKIG